MDSTTICNLALSKIGDQSIVSMSDASIEARFCNLYYPVVLQEVLMLNTWDFAIKQALLSKVSAPPLFDWAYAFLLPNDFGRMNSLYDYSTTGAGGPEIPYQIMGATLLTDISSAAISYISTTVDPLLFTPTFVQGLALKLAVELCKPLAGSLDLKNNLLSEFNRTMGEAGKIDANDSRPRKIEPWVNSALVASRFAGYPI